jgi:GNAT superfamily N-acetyltransferase
MNEPGLAIRPVRFTDRDTQRLVAEVQAEYVLRYGGPDDTPLEDGVFDPPRGAFFLGYLGDVPVAMGGWRLRNDVHPWGCRLAAEVKRMYVAATGRRRGFARAVLARLESTARDAGADVMVLETGTAQPEAIALYTTQGYEPIEKFGHYAWSPQSRSFGKRL